MKFLLLLSVLALACQENVGNTPDAQVKYEFEIEEDNQEAVAKNWHYAKYKFSLATYKDNYLAVRVGVNDDNEAKRLELKDLKTGREARAVETADLSGENNAENTAYKFRGTSSLPDGGIDYGGEYTGSLTLDAEGSVTDCCGEMTFKPTKGEGAQTQKDLTFTGTKITETFGETEWNAAVGVSSPSPSVSPPECEDFKLVFSELKDIERGENFDMNVSLQTCAGEAVTKAKDVEVTLQHTHKNTTNWTDSAHTGKKLNADGNISYNKLFIVINPENHARQDFKYRASIELDHDDDASTDPKTYTAESNTFALNPATDVVGKCADDNYSLEVSKTNPTGDVNVGATYTIKATLKCDGNVVSKITEDKAANAPVTLLQFKSGAGEWTDNEAEKGALAAGEKQFNFSVDSPGTIKYKIGVTINGKQHTSETSDFNVTNDS